MITGYASVLGTLSWCTLSHHVCKKGKKKEVAGNNFRFPRSYSFPNNYTFFL